MFGMVRRAIWILAACLVSCGALQAQLTPANPAELPRYDLTLEFDDVTHIVKFRDRVTWTNTSTKPTRDLVFNFYPLYRVPAEDSFLLAKTLELLRLDPSYGFDGRGSCGRIDSVLAVDNGTKTALTFTRKSDNQTSFCVELLNEVAPGASVTVELTGSVVLPNKQGRWGHWKGVSYLTNSLPVLSFHDDRGWHDVPFVPWHQPFWNEAGIYTAEIHLPKHQKLACSAEVASEEALANGWKKLRTKPFVGRDFAIVASADFVEHITSVKVPDGRTIAVKCLAHPEHDHYAKEMSIIAAEAIQTYSQWLGGFPYEQFTIVESYFGWNGNECGGLIMIDERVFDMPHLARGYVEYLVSHETCHQWFYNVLGTNGYSETVMDEGLATYFTHRFLDRKRGRNNDLLTWPVGNTWLPNIRRENYRFASWYGAMKRSDAPAAAGALPEFGHIIRLFSGAYDRGSKTFELIETRMGEAAFMDFTRELMKKYAFCVISIEQYKAELIAYGGPQSEGPWTELFRRWMYSEGLVDWSVDSVSVNNAGPRQMRGDRIQPGKPVRVEVKLSQHREYSEATTLGVQFRNGDGFPVRIPLDGRTLPPGMDEHDVEIVPASDGKGAVVRFTVPQEPTQISVDPDRVLLDANLGNNDWVRKPRVQVLPFYTFIHDTDLTNDYDRWNISAGPWFFGQFMPDPWYTRTSLLGARVGAYRTQTFAGGAYVALRPDYRDLVVGVDGVFDHFPTPKTQVGFNVEQRIAGPFDSDGEQTATRAVLYGRYIFQLGSSLYQPPISYVDLFTTYQDNFLPNAREVGSGSIRPDWMWLNGLHYRLNLYTPYWNAERGGWLDLVYAGGTADLNGRVATHQLRGEAAIARKLPDGLGWFSDIRWVGRGVAQGAVPGRGQFFALGGSQLYRGFDLQERQGSALWVANVEARMPVFRDVRWNFVDRILGVRNVDLAAFYDVGAIYNNGDRINNTAHAVGAGLRVDLAFFSFIERAVVRFDVAKTVNAATPVQFWFGVQQPF